MSRIQYACIIETDTGQTHEGWGLYDGVFAWIDGNQEITFNEAGPPDPLNNGGQDSFATGILTENGFEGFGYSADLKTLGGYAAMASGSIKIRNHKDPNDRNTFIDFLRQNEIYLYRRRVWFYVVTVEYNYATFIQWNYSIIDNISYTETEVTLNLIDTFKDIHKDFPNTPVSPTQFPNAPDEVINNPLPNCLGYVSHAGMINLGGEISKEIVYREGITQNEVAPAILVTYNTIFLWQKDPLDVTGWPNKYLVAVKSKDSGNMQSRLITSARTLPFLIIVTVSEPFDGFDMTGTWNISSPSAAWWFGVWDIQLGRVLSDGPVDMIFGAERRWPLSVWDENKKKFLPQKQILATTSATGVLSTGYAGVLIAGGDPTEDGGLSVPVNNYIKPKNVTLKEKTFVTSGPAMTENDFGFIEVGDSLSLLTDGHEEAANSYHIRVHQVKDGSGSSFNGFSYILTLRLDKPDDLIVGDDDKVYALFNCAISNNSADQYLSCSFKAGIGLNDSSGGQNGTMTRLVNGNLVTNELAAEAEIIDEIFKLDLVDVLKNYLNLISPASSIDVVGIQNDYFNNTSSPSNSRSANCPIMDITEYCKGKESLVIYPSVDLHFVIQADTQWPVPFKKHSNSVDMTFKATEAVFLIVRKGSDAPDEIYTSVIGEKYGNSWSGRGRSAAAPVLGPVDMIEHIIRAKDGAADFIDTESFDNVANNHRPGTGVLGWFTGAQLTERKNSSEYLEELCQHIFAVLVPKFNGKRALKTWFASIHGAKPDDFPLLDESKFIADSIEDVGETEQGLCYSEFEMKFNKNPSTGEFDSKILITNLDQDEFPAADPNDPVYHDMDFLAYYKPPVPSGVFTIQVHNTPYTGLLSFLNYFSLRIPVHVGDYIQIVDGYGGWNSGARRVKSVSLLTPTVAQIQFAYHPGDIIPPSTGTNTGILKYAVQTAVDWKNWVSGLEAFKSSDPDALYTEAKTLWENCKRGYEITKNKNRLELELPWFPDPADWDDPYRPSYAAPVYLLNELTVYLTRPKRISRGKLPITADNLQLEIADTIVFKDQKLTGDKRYYGWLVDIGLDTENNQLEVEILWFPWIPIDVDWLLAAENSVDGSIPIILENGDNILAEGHKYAATT